MILIVSQDSKTASIEFSESEAVVMQQIGEVVALELFLNEYLSHRTDQMNDGIKNTLFEAARVSQAVRT